MKRLPSKLNLQPYMKEDSGVEAFQIGDDFIILKFKRHTEENKQTYLYNYEVPGKQHVEEMKKLALEGKGLAGYKNKLPRGNDFYAFWNEKLKRFLRKGKL